ncbi:DEAD/DEAH box helicase [Massilia sp. RP-1-19]|uniref:DEAD/DEAH box helicase n=1 Tax=Massilia polaris TaxID=2728846 RepID=A0A848HR76_9BURK|nr:DEAD/DEAH box helicase [Massilia polaris]NML61098.1 DEAD/DEAH box helicase [Massilia polaris]
MSADMILSRIGNFPGRQLLREKFHASSDSIIPIPLAMERLVREIENSISVNVTLTDFQYKLYEDLKTNKSLSVSAPTSAGKSFVLNLDLTRRLRSAAGQCIIYVVPTRALVAEVTGRIRATLRSENMLDVIVRTAPFPVVNIEKFNGVVFVLTQERLLSLLSASKAKTPISLLIVDEAHELQKGKRGILLQNSIDLALAQSPQADVFFASPLIKNPEYFLHVFARANSGNSFTEEISPVSQNIILVSPVSGKPKQVEISISVQDTNVRVGRAELEFRFRDSVSQQKAKFAASICRDGESVIIFASSASDAEKSAVCLAANLNNFEASDEILDFVKFLRSEIHPDYVLIESLLKGVGFHYGNMPSIVRTGVERFFKNGQIRYLCCTSTLLQGVNLPAKHIVIHDPHLGQDPMMRPDFRNLAGRAGRLLKEFHGNIWCIRPQEWDVKSFAGENLQEITSAMSSVMTDGGTIIQAITNAATEDIDKDLADAAYSRLYHELRENSDSHAKIIELYSTPENIKVLEENIKSLKALPITIPGVILDSHRSLRPDLLQILYEKIQAVPRMDELILINPHESGGKLRMTKAISMIHDAFNINMTELQNRWICNLAHDWVWGKPIGEIIKFRVDFVQSRDRDVSVSQVIRDLLQAIEKEIRYSLVKYFGAYEDLLKLALENLGDKQKASSVSPYHVYLEFGSSNSVTLGLMALGLSRFTAIKLTSVINWGEAKEPEELLAKIRRLRTSSLGLPKVCQLEVNEILGID